MLLGSHLNRHRSVKCLFVGLCYGRAFRGTILEAIATSSSSIVNAVGQQLLAFDQLYRATSPEHAIADAVGKVTGALFLEADEACILRAKTRVMRGCY